MSFLGGERTGLNPKYVSKLIETRLYAIKEKKQYDGAIFTFYCPKCKHNNTVMKPIFIGSLTMDSFMHAVSGYRFETHTCACGNKLNSNNIIVAQYNHFFPDTKLDLEAEVTAGSEFVSFYRMDIDGNRVPLKGSLDFKTVFETFGHVLSIRECWKNTIATAFETDNVRMYQVETGYIIVALPGDAGHDVTVRDIIGPGWTADKAVMIRLRDVENEGGTLSDTFIDWMPEYTEDILKKRIDAIAVIDKASFYEAVQQAMADEGMEYEVQGDSLIIRKKMFSTKLSIKELFKYIVFCGKSFRDAVVEKSEMELNRIFIAETTYNSLVDSLPSYNFTVEGDILIVENPRNGLQEKVNLFAPLPRGGVRIIAGRLKEALTTPEKFQPKCSCGKDAFVIKTIEPTSWLTDNADSFNSVYEERENAVVVYYLSCGEHAEPVKKTDLGAWIVERKDLDEIFDHELDNLRVSLEAHKGIYGKNAVIGVLGRRACDIMVHPSLVKGLMDAMNVSLGNRLIVYAPLKEMVLIYREDTDLESLNEAVTDLQTLAAEKDLAATPLDYIDVVDLDKGHGIFNFITLPPKPLEQMPEPVLDEPGIVEEASKDITEKTDKCFIQEENDH